MKHQSLLAIALGYRIRVIEHFDPPIRQIHNPILRNPACGIGFSFPSTVVRQARIRNLNQEEDITRLRVFMPVLVWIKTADRNIRLWFTPIGKDYGRLRTNSEMGSE